MGFVQGVHKNNLDGISYDDGVDVDNGDGVGGGGKVQGNVCSIAPLHHYHCV